MINMIIISTIILSVIGLFISIQTIIETRRKYYHDYIVRKRKLNAEKDMYNTCINKKNENRKTLKK